MKRLLLIAALCLAAAPAEADVFHVQDGQYIVLGDFSNYVGSDINGHIIEYNISATPFSGIAYDPINGPYFSYQGSAHVNFIAEMQSCFSSQAMSMCGRNLRNQPAFDVSDTDGDGVGYLDISSDALSFNMAITGRDIVISLPDGFTLQQIAAVPEPSTWAMMLLGFAGIGFLMVKRNMREPLLRVRRVEIGVEN